MKEKLTLGGHCHQIIFLRFCSEIYIDQANDLFCVIQSPTSNNFFFYIFLNARDNGVVSIGYIIDIVNPDPNENYIIGVPIIALKEQSILMLPMNYSPIPMCN